MSKRKNPIEIVYFNDKLIFEFYGEDDERNKSADPEMQLMGVIHGVAEFKFKGKIHKAKLKREKINRGKTNKYELNPVEE